MVNKSVIARTIGTKFRKRFYCTSVEKKNRFSDIIMSMTIKKTKNPDAKVPSQVYLHIVGNGSLSEPAGVLLSTPSKKYLFQCCQGVQRLIEEHRLRLTTLEGVFITHKQWEKVGGLPGMMISLKEAGVSKRLSIYGPPYTTSFLTDVAKHEICTDDDIGRPSYESVYKDETVSITPVVLFGDKISLGLDSKYGEAHYHGNWYKSWSVDEGEDEDDDVGMVDSDALEQKQKQMFDNWRKRRRMVEHGIGKKVKFDNTHDMAIAYVCKLTDYPGALQIDKCREKNVPVGPLLGQLKQGEEVTLEDGTVVRPEDVRAPDIPGSSFIIIDCPATGFLPSLTTCDELSAAAFPLPPSSGALSAVLHLTPQHVIDTDTYQQWINSFPEEVKHVVVNESCSGAGCCSNVYKMQSWLNLLSAHIHPLLPAQHHLLQQEKEATDVPSSDSGSETKRREPVRALCGMKVWLRPTCYIDCESTTPSDHHQQQLDLLKEEAPEFDSALKKMLSRLKKEEDARIASTLAVESSIRYPHLVFLGTISACPSKARNVSGILLHLDADRCMLLDCGEGTLGQLRRFYGDSGADQVLRKLKCIFVSHKHADHHMALLNILKAREALMRDLAPDDPDRDVWLCAPRKLIAWFDYCIKSFVDLAPLVSAGFKLIPNHSWLNADDLLNRRSAAHTELLQQLNLENFETVFAKHIYDSHSVVLTCKDGRKLVYSGDTMPNDELVIAGKNCDLLIHEATFGNEDYLVDMARLKKHSTQKEAVEVGQKMEAKFTLLTHFSARTAKMPFYTFDKSVGIAFDMMKVDLDNLWRLPYFTEPLKIMFSKYLIEMESKDHKARLKRHHVLKLQRGDSVEVDNNIK